MSQALCARCLHPYISHYWIELCVEEGCRCWQFETDGYGRDRDEKVYYQLTVRWRGGGVETLVSQGCNALVASQNAIKEVAARTPEGSFASILEAKVIMEVEA